MRLECWRLVLSAEDRCRLLAMNYLIMNSFRALVDDGTPVIVGELVIAGAGRTFLAEILG